MVCCIIDGDLLSRQEWDGLLLGPRTVFESIWGVTVLANARVVRGLVQLEPNRNETPAINGGWLDFMSREDVRDGVYKTLEGADVNVFFDDIMFETLTVSRDEEKRGVESGMLHGTACWIRVDRAVVRGATDVD